MLSRYDRSNSKSCPSVLNFIFLFGECHVPELDFRLIATASLTLPPSEAVVRDKNLALTWSVWIILSNSDTGTRWLGLAVT
jgi:hypothetical protein